MAFLWVKVVILVSLFTTGCTFSKKSPDEVKAEAFDEVSQRMRESTLDTREAALSVSDFQVSFEDGAEPNQYSLVVKAKRKVPKLIVTTGLTQAFEFKDTEIAKIPVNWEDLFVNLRVSTMTRDNITASSLDLGTFEIPRDLIFSENLFATSDIRAVWQTPLAKERHYRKIIFKRGVQLVLNGFDLELQSEFLVFEGDNKIAVHDGRYERIGLVEKIFDGSDIKIFSEKAKGSVTLSLVGLKGKNGQSARVKAYSQKPSPFQPARAGEAGQPAQYQEIYKTSMGPDATPSSEMICTRQPTHGTNGQDGIIIHGDDGTDGGDTGNLLIDIKDYSQARFRIFFIPGSGGLGGAGDFEGQKGGAGGAAGPGGKPCIPAMAGKAGRDSIPQDSIPGRDGRDGKMGVLSIPQDAKHFDVISQIE